MLGHPVDQDHGQAWAIDLAISMIDLTTLEGADTPGKVRAMCAKARRPDPADPTAPAGRRGVRLPRPGRTSPRQAVRAPASRSPRGHRVPVRPGRARGQAGRRRGRRRGGRRRGRHGDRPRRVPGRPVPAGLRGDRRGPRGLPGRAAHLKVILETGELATLDNVRRASWLAMLAGADFIKTSTGKVSPPPRLPVTLVMLRGGARLPRRDRRQVGVKAAGGIRTAKDAIRYLVLVNETVGEDWLDPDWFRLRRLQPAQRPAHAAHQAAHRPLLRPRLLHAGLTWEVRVRPRPGVARRSSTSGRPTGCSSTGTSSTRPTAELQDDQPGHRGGPRRGGRGGAGRRGPRRGRRPAGLRAHLVRVPD